MNSQLLFEVLERIEFMRSVEVFVVFAVGAFNLAIVSWRKGLNEFVPDTELFQLLLEQMRSCLVRNELLGEFCAVVSLDAENLEWSSLDQMLKELGR